MPTRTNNSLPKLSYHFQFLGRIYAFIGWMGLIGSVFLFLAMFTPTPEAAATQQTGSIQFLQILQAVLLACWSILLLNFSKDIYGAQAWSTGPGGCIVGLLNLLAVPLGTAIGTYTLWVLFKCRNNHSRSIKGSLHA